MIGLTVPSLTHPFFICLRDSVVDEAEKLGVEVIIADAEDVPAKQMSIIENFIARGVEGVLISPIGTDSLVQAVEDLNEAGIPVATVDRQVNGGTVLVHVGADNVEGGRAAARFILGKLADGGKVIELEGLPGASPTIDRKKGFHEAVAGTKVEVVVSQTANFKRAEGQAVMENLLQVHKDFQAVYAANDEMMLGAIEGAGGERCGPRSGADGGLRCPPGTRWTMCATDDWMRRWSSFLVARPARRCRFWSSICAAARSRPSARCSSHRS